jgi:subtilisin family serine protease
VTCGLDDYQLATGTSFAAPFVTSAAALLVSRAARRSVALDGAAVRRILAESAGPWPSGTESGNGSGVLDVYAALRQLDHEITQSSEHRHAAHRAARSAELGGGRSH